MPRFRIGIIGAGGRGIRSFGHLLTRYHSSQTEIAAIAEPNRERAEGGLEYLGIKADIHADYHDLVARRDIDAVIVTTPDYLHEKPCVAAFKHGKHVLVDKPLAVTAKGCLRVVAAAKRARKLLYMGFNLRQDAVVRRLKQLVDAGTLGQIFSIHAVEHYNGGRSYMSRWNRLKKYSGGLFIHKGSHDFDVINWLMGSARPMRVSAFANVSVLNPKGLPFKPRKGVKPGPTCTVCKYGDRCPDRYIPGDDTDAATQAIYRRRWGPKAVKFDGYHKNLCMYLSDKDTHDQGVAIVEYDTGATAMHSECFFTSVTDRRYMLDGDLGHAEASLHGNTIDLSPRWSQERIHHDVDRGAGGHGGSDPKMVAEFVDCLVRKRRPTASGIDGAWSVAIGEAAELARAKGRVVKIAEVLDVKSPLLRRR